MADKDIIPIEIDLNRKDKLNESFLRMFGDAIKWVLRRMFGQEVFVPINVTGTTDQIEAFTKALAGEKRYFESYVKYGLNDPRTHEDRYRLNIAVDKFERDTGIKWPYK